MGVISFLASSIGIMLRILLFGGFLYLFTKTPKFIEKLYIDMIGSSLLYISYLKPDREFYENKDDTWSYSFGSKH